MRLQYFTLGGLSLSAGRGTALPRDVPTRRNTAGGQFGGLGGTRTRGEAPGAGLEPEGRTVAPRERGNPALVASSERLALADGDSKAGRQSTFPCAALPFPGRAAARGECFTHRCFTHWHLPPVRVPTASPFSNPPPRGPNNFGPCRGNLGNKYL